MNKNTPLNITELMNLDSLAKLKGRRWIHRRINDGKLKALNTGTDRKSFYYVYLDDWNMFVEKNLKT